MSFSESYPTLIVNDGIGLQSLHFLQQTMLILFITSPPTHSIPGKSLAQSKFLVNICTVLINGRYDNLAWSILN